MKIKIPTNRGITVRTYIAWMKCKTDLDRMKVITGWTEKRIGGLQPDTIEKTIELFSQSINDETGEFVRSFRVRKDFKKKTLAIIPNFESMTYAEYVDTDTMVKEVFEKKKWDKLPDLLCVLYRPIKNKLGDWYVLEKYDPDKVPYYKEYILDMPIYNVNGLLAFFLTFAIELSKASQASLNQTMERIANQTETLD